MSDRDVPAWEEAPALPEDGGAWSHVAPLAEVEARRARIAREFDGDLWLRRAKRCGPRAAHEYVQLRDAGLVPPGVPLYRTKHLAKEAAKYAERHPSRVTPRGLVPVAFT